MLKKLNFVDFSQEDIKSFPAEVRSDIGYVLFAAQRGDKSEAVKLLNGYVRGVYYEY